MAAFASLTDLKIHLNISGSSSDAELGLMLDSADGLVRSIIGPLTGGTVVAERVTMRSGTVVLPVRPVTGDVTVLAGTTPVTGFVLNRAAGLLYDVPASSVPLTVSYTVGVSAVPAAVLLATLIIAGHLWETQRGTSPSALSLQQADEGAFPYPAGYAIPNRAKELLEPYIRSRVSQVA